MSETYLIKRKCDNCLKENVLNIPKGVSIKDFYKGKKKKCFFCGCDLE